MKTSLLSSVRVAAMVSATLFLFSAAPSSGGEVAWLAGDMVTIAPNRMELTPFPTPGDHPLTGYLARPDQPGRHPAVIELHGCGGFGPMDIVAAEILKSFGYVALALDSLGEENVCERNTDYGELAQAFDAYAAFEWLARQTYVDADRVALAASQATGAWNRS